MTLTIFIHGLGSDSSRWSNILNDLKQLSDDKENKQGLSEYKIGNNIHDDKNYYYLYDYTSQFVLNQNRFIKFFKSFLGEKDHSEIGIDELVSVFATTFAGLKDKFKKINIVGHSLGGVILLKFILNSKSTTNKINKIFYLASPFLGSDDPNKVIKLLNNKINKNIFNYQITRIMEQLKTSSPFMDSLETSIRNNKGYLNSGSSIYYAGINDDRIQDCTKLLKDNVENWIVKDVECDHSNIIESNNKDFLFAIYEVLYGENSFGLELANNFNDIHKKNESSNFLDYFEVCPPQNMDTGYCEKIVIQSTKHELKFIEEIYKMCFDINNVNNLEIDIDETMLLSKDDSLNLFTKYNPEVISNLFLKEYYNYPRVRLCSYSQYFDANRDEHFRNYNPVEVEECLYNALKIDNGLGKVILLSGDIGEGKTTLLKKFYIDTKKNQGKHIIPIYFSIKDKEYGEKFQIDFLLDYIIKKIQNTKLQIKLNDKEINDFVDFGLGEKRIKKLKSQEGKINIHEYVDCVIDAKGKNLGNILEFLNKQKISVVLLLDNLDSFLYTDERYMFLKNGFKEFNFGVKEIKNIVDEVSTFKNNGLSMIFAMRPYVLSHITNNIQNNANFNADITNSLIVNLVENVKDSNEVIRSRILLMHDLLKIISNKNKNNTNLILKIKPYIELLSTISNRYIGYHRDERESITEKFYKIATEGYRTIIKFYSHLPFDVSFVERYFDSNDILFLYKLGLQQKYCQILPRYKNGINGLEPCNMKIDKGTSGKEFNYPNMFLIVSKNECNVQLSECKENKITFWLKYLVLLSIEKIANYNTLTYNGIENIFLGRRRQTKVYDDEVLALTVGSLGTVNEYNCIKYNFHTVEWDFNEENLPQMLQDMKVNTSLSLTKRGKTLSNIDTLLDFSNLQFYAEDWLMPKPRLNKVLKGSDNSKKLRRYIKSLYDCKGNYQYLVNGEIYSDTLHPLVMDKARVSIWFLTLLEFSLKYEKLLYKDVFDNLSARSISVELTEEFFKKKKENIISIVQKNILHSYYIRNSSEKLIDKKSLNEFLNLCNSTEVRDSIDKYFLEVYSSEIKFNCLN